jgi:hypothetical protein
MAIFKIKYFVAKGKINPLLGKDVGCGFVNFLQVTRLNFKRGEIQITISSVIMQPNWIYNSCPFLLISLLIPHIF